MADYCTAADIKAAMPDTTWGTDYDTLFGELATRASREFDRLTHWAPGSFAAGTDAARTYDGTGHLVLWLDALAAAPTLVEVDEAGTGSYTAWAASDYRCWPYNALAKGEPYVRLDINSNGDKSYWPGYAEAVRVTGKFGFSTTPPDDVAWAVIRMAMRMFKRSQQAYNDVGAIPELGQLRYVKGGDPEVDRIVRQFARITT